MLPTDLYVPKERKPGALAHPLDFDLPYGYHGLTGTAVINGAFEGWIDRNNRSRRAWTAPVENQGTMAVPACALRAISVGNHDRTAPLPNISATSSCGPTRDGRVKPDISAVGNNVTAPWYQLINIAAPPAWNRLPAPSPG